MSSRECMEGVVRMTLPSDPAYLPLVRSVVDQLGHLVGFEEDVIGRLELALTEAVTNVIRHVYDGAHDQRIDLAFHRCDDGLRIELVDYGTFVDPARIASRPLEDVRPGGLGVHLIKSTMDEVEYVQNDHGGTTLILAKSSRREA